MRAPSALAAVVLLALAMPLAAGAPGDPDWPDGKHNPFGRDPVRLFVDASNLTGPATRYADEAREAARYWEGGGNGRLRWNVTFEPAASREDADVVLWFVDASRVSAFCGSRANALGCGGIATDDGGRTRGFAELVTRDARERYLTYEAVRVVAAHELGHALGLLHSEAGPDDVMAPTVDVSDHRGPRPILGLAWKVAAGAGAAGAAVLLPVLAFRALGRRTLAEQVHALPTWLPPCTRGFGGAHPRLSRRAVKVRGEGDVVVEACRACGGMRRVPSAKTPLR